METFEVHSKSFAIKWVKAPDNSVIKWELKPLKRSINLGIYRYNSSSGLNSENASSSCIDHSSPNHSSATTGPFSGSNLSVYSEAGSNTSPGSGSVTTSTTVSKQRNASNTTRASLFSTQNVSVDMVNRVPRKLFSVIHQTFFSPESARSGSSENPSSSSLASQNGKSKIDECIDRHLTQEQWVGKCEGGEFVSDKFIVKSGGLFAFVFDNTFSRTKAKRVMFSQWLEGKNKKELVDGKSTEEKATPVKCDICTSEEAKDLPKHQPIKSSVKQQNCAATTAHIRFQLPEEKQMGKNTFMIRLKGVQYLQGFLRKKRRRAGGNFVKRFFTLNFKYAVLDYYEDETSNKIRGNMLVTQAVISADAKLRMLYLDSGMEQWILKALTKEDFDIWLQAFDYIKRRDRKEREQVTSSTLLPAASIPSGGAIQAPGSPVSTIAVPLPLPDESQAANMASIDRYVDQNSYNADTRSFRGNLVSEKRRAAISGSLEELQHLADAVADQFATFKKAQSSQQRGKLFSRHRQNTEVSSDWNETTSSAIEAVQAKVEDVRAEFAALVDDENGAFVGSILSGGKKTLTRTNTNATSYLSQEFYDAQEVMEQMNEGVMMVGSEEGEEEDMDEVSLQTADTGMSIPAKIDRNIFEGEVESGSIESESTDENEESSESTESTNESNENEVEEIGTKQVVPSAIHDLYPLPVDFKPVYRLDIPCSASPPPSLIGILRKNLGKDLSGITMPITSNEPLSFLQKYSECYEYAGLLNEAANIPEEDGSRLLKVACFAISYLSSYRSKTRSLRKPFNPLLGETFELVRPEIGMRLVCEKVIHHPVVFASRAEGERWQIDHCFSPKQKFYGKTAEITMDGKVHLQLTNESGTIDTYQWAQPTTILRNVISLTGEKYTEPTAKMTVHASTGYKAVVTFVPDRSRFVSHRSEKLTIKVYPPGSDRPLSNVAIGTWTSSVRLENGGKTLWSAGMLVPEPETKYGFTEFAAGLNAFTMIDRDCAPTDSRRRPDQKLYEQGEVDTAEQLKLQLEQEQRERRKGRDGKPIVHHPAFFERKGAGQLTWQFKEGPQSYWERRRRHDWTGMLKLWDEKDKSKL